MKVMWRAPSINSHSEPAMPSYMVLAISGVHSSLVPLIINVGTCMALSLPV